MTGALRVRFHARTDVGRVRSHNEDAYSLCPEAGFCAVADGMGGLERGEEASRRALETLRRSLLERAAADPGDLAGRVRQVNRAVHAWSQGYGLAGKVGTTLVALQFAGGRVRHVHVGDSRIYLLREDVLVQVTRDHSLLDRKVRDGRMTYEEGVRSGEKRFVTRALGVATEVAPEAGEAPIRMDDLFLLCSDGLTDDVTDAEIEGVLLNAEGDLESAAENLVRLANARGGKDNITVVLAVVESARAPIDDPPTEDFVPPGVQG